MIFKMPCENCEPGKGDEYNAWSVDKRGREKMMCGHKPCLEKSYCLLLNAKLVKKEE